MIWEEEQMEKVYERFEPTKKRRAFDPCFERLKKRRRHHWSCASTESPVNRKEWQKHIRTKFKNIDEESYHPTTHEYWTHGWLTW